MEYQEYVEKIGRKFAEVMFASDGRDYTYSFKAWEIGIVHGLVALAADHPGIQDMGPNTHRFISDFRSWCKEVWVDMGLTEEEAELIDRLREER